MKQERGEFDTPLLTRIKKGLYVQKPQWPLRADSQIGSRELTPTITKTWFSQQPDELKSGLSPRVSREPSLAHTLVLASGDPEQRAQLSHARLLTYKTVSYEVYVALSHYVYGNTLMAATETNAQGGNECTGRRQCIWRGWQPPAAQGLSTNSFLPSFTFFTWFMGYKSIF